MVWIASLKRMQKNRVDSQPPRVSAIVEWPLSTDEKLKINVSIALCKRYGKVSIGIVACDSYDHIVLLVII